MSNDKSTDTRVQRFVDQHREFAAALNGGADAPVHEKRLRALEEFTGMGFPTLRDEEWRYTNIKPVTEVAYLPPGTAEELPGASDIDGLLAGYAGGPLLVFVNGRFSGELSRLGELADGVVVEDLQTAIAADLPGVSDIDSLRGDGDSAFAALNTAFMHHGAYLHVGAGVAAGVPVHCLFVTQPGSGPVQAHPRLFVRVEEGGSLQLVEQYSATGNGPSLTNALVEAHVGAGARLSHMRLQLEAEDAYHVATSLATIGRDATYENHFFSFGAAMVRNDIRTVLAGEGGHCVLNGLYMPRGRQHMDSHTLIDHARPHCTSEELYKGVLDDEGRGVFSGRIIVRQDAQKTDARQANKNLLLSEKAMIDTKPQLEIYADDVRCTHGATIGRIDETALFYLRSRGIAEADARDILSYAFASDTVHKVGSDALRDWLDSHIQSLLAMGRQKG